MRGLVSLALVVATVSSCAPGAISLGVADVMGRAPSDEFELTNWKLTLPVDEDRGTDGEAIEIEDLTGYEDPDHFYDAPDGAMVFAAAVDGATTSGSQYPRSELREMRRGERAAWHLSEGGTMTATLRVDSVPARSNGSPGRIVIGQIHGEDDELVRLYYENSTLYFVNDRAGADDEESDFALQNALGEEPDIALGERFSYLIDAHDAILTVEAHADMDVYRSTTPINDVWQSDTFYFKAGVYLGVNDETGAGVGQASFYALDVGHEPGGGLNGLR